MFCEPSRVLCRFLSLKGSAIPKKYPAEVHDRAVRMALDLLKDYPSVWAAWQALAPKLDVGAETLRKWIVQAQVDACTRVGPTTKELEEIKQLKRENRDLKLKEANEIFPAASIFFTRDPTLATADCPAHRSDESERSEVEPT